MRAERHSARQRAARGSGNDSVFATGVECKSHITGIVSRKCGAQVIGPRGSDKQIVVARTAQFYRNLSGDFDHVTIDTWMAKIYGVDFQGITDAERESLQDDVKAIADAAGITPAAAQAALWVGYRELQGHSDSEGALSVLEVLEEN